MFAFENCMRVLIAALSVIIAVSAYDAVYFSNQRDIQSSKLENIVNSASADEPVVFIVNPDFTLGQFSVKANAYSSEPTQDYLAKLVKSSKYHGATYFTEQFIVPTASVLTSSSDFKTGSSVYVLAGEEWTSAEELAQQVLEKIENAVVIITATDGVSQEKTRVKRVGLTGGESRQNDAEATGNIALPLILPPYNVTGLTAPANGDSSCLFYLEGLDVVVQKKDSGKTTYSAAAIRQGNATWSYADGYASCVNSSVGSFVFRISLTTTGEVADSGDLFTIPSGSNIDVSLTINGTKDGYWQLVGATLNSASINLKNGGAVTASGVTVGEGATQYTGLNSVAGFALTCSQTQAVFFATNNDAVRIGLSLHNSQVQTYVVMPEWKQWAYFTRQTEDCTGTFSSGSWMGILSALVLITGLIFGYLMLQSVQTQDRFDDPKQKQIVINVRE
ncbi:unnamed protein product [Caenorhabditis angaria]|uniref:V-type proton ATPase subunit S1/VOA1 transmembrane domain-containing protein n=1 Tax=Caenorhabditis angaria TaxID=860376 RepID=A0A9P1IQ46_9PELO|nr:unnamed protein product [Caenorhabditis angaria]